MKSNTFSTDPRDFVPDSPMRSNDDNESEKDEIDKEKCEETFKNTEKDKIARLSRYKELNQKLQEIKNGGEPQKEITYDNKTFKQIPIAGDGDCLFTSVLTGYLMIDKVNWDSMIDKTRINIGNIGLNDGNTAIKFTDANIRSMVKNYVCRKRDEIQETKECFFNKLSQEKIKEISELRPNDYGGDNELIVLSHILNKQIVVIKPYNNRVTHRVFDSNFCENTEENLTELLKQKLDKPEPIILHNTGSENKKEEDLRDSVAEHFNLLLTREQYNKFKIIIQRLENFRNGVTDAMTTSFNKAISNEDFNNL